MLVIRASQLGRRVYTFPSIAHSHVRAKVRLFVGLSGPARFSLRSCGATNVERLASITGPDNALQLYRRVFEECIQNRSGLLVRHERSETVLVRRLCL